MSEGFLEKDVDADNLPEEGTAQEEIQKDSAIEDFIARYLPEIHNDFNRMRLIRYLREKVFKILFDDKDKEDFAAYLAGYEPSGDEYQDIFEQRAWIEYRLHEKNKDNFSRDLDDDRRKSLLVKQLANDAESRREGMEKQWEAILRYFPSLENKKGIIDTFDTLWGLDQSETFIADVGEALGLFRLIKGNHGRADYKKMKSQRKIKTLIDSKARIIGLILNKIPTLNRITAVAALSQITDSWFDLLALGKILYEELGFDPDELLDVCKTMKQEINGALNLTNQLNTIAHLELESPGLVKKLRSRNNIKFFYAYDYEELYQCGQKNIDDNAKVDLQIRFPRAAYSAGTHKEVTGDLSKRELDIEEHPQTSYPFSPGNVDFYASDLPLEIVECRDIEELEALTKRFKDRVRTLILHGHGNEDIIVVSTTESSRQVLNKREIGRRPFKGLWETVDKSDPNACIVAFSCFVGAPKGIAQSIARHTGVPTYGPTDYISKVVIENKGDGKKVQFWTLDQSNEYIVAIRTSIFN